MDTCACADGYEPARTGCVEKLTPSVQVVVSLGGNPEQLFKGSGEVIVGGEITLKCTTDPAEMGTQIVWSKDSVEIAGGGAGSLVLSDVTSVNNGQYRCQARDDVNGYVSALSDPMTVTVIEDGSFQSQPIVTGMYKQAMENSEINLECTNIPSGVDLVVEWYLLGENVHAQTNIYTFYMTSKNQGKSITCKVAMLTTANNIKFSVKSPESAPVTIPASLTEDITGVYIQEARLGTQISTEVGSDVNFNCKILDTDLGCIEF